jgi:hypothetical protein
MRRRRRKNVRCRQRRREKKLPLHVVHIGLSVFFRTLTLDQQ